MCGDEDEEEEEEGLVVQVLNTSAVRKRKVSKQQFLNDYSHLQQFSGTVKDSLDKVGK